jgi:hypothetical protein
MYANQYAKEIHIVNVYLNQIVGFQIDGGRRLVEHQNARLTKQCSGETHELSLSDGEILSSLADRMIQSGGET